MELHLPYKLLLVSIASSLLLGYLFHSTAIFSYPYNFFVGTISVVFGLFLGLWAKRIIQHHKTTLNPYGEPSALVVRGPFRWSRNPMYVSYVLIALGAAIFSGSLISFIPPVLYFLYLNYKIIPQEEERLLKNFSNLYTEYCQKVRRWI